MGIKLHSQTKLGLNKCRILLQDCIALDCASAPFIWRNLNKLTTQIQWCLPCSQSVCGTRLLLWWQSRKTGKPVWWLTCSCKSTGKDDDAVNDKCWDVVPSLRCPHTAGQTDISTAKIISLPDLSQAGQECVIGTACISMHNNTRLSLQHAGTHGHTHRHTGAHRYHRSISVEKDTDNKDIRISHKHHWQYYVRWLQILNLLLFSLASNCT